jgi:hypothetical protein
MNEVANAAESSPQAASSAKREAPVPTVHLSRSCRDWPLAPIISLGVQPLANALLPKERLGQPEPT